MAQPSGPVSLDPLLAPSEEFTSCVLSRIYEPLVTFGSNLAVAPGLAESWRTENDLTWVFEIRRGVRLHDGRTLKASDIAESLELVRSHPESSRRGELTSVKSIETEDPHRLVITTHLPFAALPNRLATVPIGVPAVDGSGHFVGSGPYQVKEWTPNGDTVLEVFSGYRDGPPPMSRLVFRAIESDAERLRLLRSGEIHVARGVPPEAAAAIAGSADTKLVSVDGVQVLFLGMNCEAEASPFRNAHVRRAVAHALDRRALVEGPLGGHGKVVSQLVAPGVFGHDPYLDSLPFAPDESKRLLAAAGLPSFSVEMDFMTGKYPQAEAVVQGLVGDLAAVGIHVTPRASEPAELIPRLRQRDVTLVFMGWKSTSGDAGATYEALLHTPGDGFGDWNVSGYSDPEVDRLLSEAGVLLKPLSRERLLREVGRRVRDQVPMIPLYRQSDIYGVARGLEFEPKIHPWVRVAPPRWRTPS